MTCALFFSANFLKAYEEQRVNRCCKGKMIKKINCSVIYDSFTTYMDEKEEYKNFPIAAYSQLSLLMDT